MSRIRFTLTLAAAMVAACVAGSAMAATAAAAPELKLDVHHSPTNFSPGGSGEYWFDIANLGDESTSGPVTLSIKLPKGMTRVSASSNFSYGFTGAWSCPGNIGDTLLSCTTGGPILRHADTGALRVLVDIEAGVADGTERFLSATLEGGGAPTKSQVIERTRIDATPAPFSILSESFTPDFFGSDGSTLVRESGAHPELFTIPFDITASNEAVESGFESKPVENVRNLRVDLPRDSSATPVW